MIIRRRKGEGITVVKKDAPVKKKFEGAGRVEEGVFIEGKPLEKYLEDFERDQKSKEVENVRRGFESKRLKTRGTYASERKALEETRRVSKRVRWLSDHEIRKEYGLMEKPFETHPENAIWVILQKGPATVRQVGEQLQWKGKGNTLSAMMATVWKRLGQDHPGAAKILDRQKDPHTPAHSYFKAEGLDISPEAAIEEYKLAGRRQAKMAVAEKRGEVYEDDTSPAPEVESAKKPERLDLNLNTQEKPDVSSRLTKVVEEAIQTTLGVKVEVSGRIEIVFKFGG